LKATIENETTYVTTHILRMRRPAARRTHWTFDVNNWDNKHVVSCC